LPKVLLCMGSPILSISGASPRRFERATFPEE
jgi:hypothetical protein